jgi:guanylate kinase
MSKKVLGNLPQGLAFVISAPAGTGKTTLAHMLRKEFPCVVESISFTTRSPRPNEVNGKDYFFISKEEFEAKIKAEEFLEYAKVFDHYYGTSSSFVEGERKKGHHVVLVIDTQGAMLIKKKLDAIFIFISPPSKEELERRLRLRRTETEEVIAKRLSWAEKEMEMANRYDYHIVNVELKIAYDVLRSVVIAEEHRIRKN